MVLSFSFLELGEALRTEAAWLTPVVLRSDVIARTEGGWSYLFGCVMRLMLLGAEGFATAGVPLSVEGEPVLIARRVRPGTLRCFPAPHVVPPECVGSDSKTNYYTDTERKELSHAPELC